MVSLAAASSSAVMTAAECIFCRIVADAAPCHEIYSDTVTLAFMDINPANEGHCLVIPKAHFGTVFEMPLEAFAAVASTVVKIAPAVNDEMRPGGLSVLQANGALAGQTVSHVHVHVLPRRVDDNLLINWGRERADKTAADPARIAVIAERLRSRLGK